jgi:hypothetical protein
MQINSLYLYPNLLDLYISDSAWKTERFRMVYNRNLKIYRGVDNRIDLQIRNSDQKKYNATGATFVMSIVSKENNDQVLKKDCEIDDLSVGRVFVTLNESELYDLEPGLYNYSFIKETRQNIDSTSYKVTSKSPAYFDSQYGAIGTLEILGDVEGLPYDTIKIDTFKKIINFDADLGTTPPTTPQLQLPRPNFAQNLNTSGYEEYFISSHVNAQPNLSTPSSLHTFQFYFNNYLGEVVLQGSLGKGGDPIEGSWTDVDTFNITTSDSKMMHNVTGKYNYFRIKHTPDTSNTGIVDKVLYR